MHPTLQPHLDPALSFALGPAVDPALCPAIDLSCAQRMSHLLTQSLTQQFALDPVPVKPFTYCLTLSYAHPLTQFLTPTLAQPLTLDLAPDPALHKRPFRPEIDVLLVKECYL